MKRTALLDKIQKKINKAQAQLDACQPYGGVKKFAGDVYKISNTAEDITRTILNHDE